MAGADLLAVEEHRRLVLLPLADHDDAVHLDGAEHQPHRVDGGLVGLLLLAPPDPAGRSERRRFGDADELEGEVAVGGGGAHRADHSIRAWCRGRLEEGRRVEQVALPGGQEDDLRRRFLQDLQRLELEVAVGQRARAQPLRLRLAARPLDLLLRLGLRLLDLLPGRERVLRRDLLALDRLRELLREVEVVDQEVDDVDREALELPVELELHRLADLLPVRRDGNALELDGLVLEDLEDARRDHLVEVGRADVREELLHRLVADAVVERDDGVDRLRLLADRRPAADRTLRRPAVVHLEALALDLGRHLLGVLPRRDRLEAVTALADDLAELAHDEHVAGVHRVEGAEGAPAADDDDDRERGGEDPGRALVRLALATKADPVHDRDDGDEDHDRRDDQIAHSGGRISRRLCESCRDSSRARLPLRTFAIARARKAVIAIELATMPRMISTLSMTTWCLAPRRRSSPAIGRSRTSSR